MDLDLEDTLIHLHNTRKFMLKNRKKSRFFNKKNIENKSQSK